MLRLIHLAKLLWLKCSTAFTKAFIDRWFGWPCGVSRRLVSPYNKYTYIAYILWFPKARNPGRLEYKKHNRAKLNNLSLLDCVLWARVKQTRGVSKASIVQFSPQKRARWDVFYFLIPSCKAIKSDKCYLFVHLMLGWDISLSLCLRD
jgi:hypothetical protein